MTVSGCAQLTGAHINISGVDPSTAVPRGGGGYEVPLMQVGVNCTGPFQPFDVKVTLTGSDSCQTAENARLGQSGSSLVVLFDLTADGCGASEDDGTMLVVAIVVPIVAILLIILLIVLLLPATRAKICPVRRREAV